MNDTSSSSSSLNHVTLNFLCDIYKDAWMIIYVQETRTGMTLGEEEDDNSSAETDGEAETFLLLCLELKHFHNYLITFVSETSLTGEWQQLR